jgi:mRNA degradation ribonuclease J1/J2
MGGSSASIANGLQTSRLRWRLGAQRSEGETRSGEGISLLHQDLHDDIAEFVYEKLRRRPLVLPVVVEV